MKMLSFGVSSALLGTANTDWMARKIRVYIRVPIQPKMGIPL
jgi:hypothetical protein